MIEISVRVLPSKSKLGKMSRSDLSFPKILSKTKQTEMAPYTHIVHNPPADWKYKAGWAQLEGE